MDKMMWCCWVTACQRWRKTIVLIQLEIDSDYFVNEESLRYIQLSLDNIDTCQYCVGEWHTIYCFLACLGIFFIDLCWEIGTTGTIAVVYFVCNCTVDVVGYSFDLNFQVHIIDKKNPKWSWIYELKKRFSCCFSMSISKSLAEAQLVFFTRNYEDLWRPINCNHHVYATPSNNNEKAMV